MTTASIALITYNGEKFLPRQLETLAAQTRLPDELVVCDDGSTDRTLEILRQFAETAPFPVRIFQNLKNLRPGGNFRRAFSLCEGDVTFFCDQDDIWFPNKVEMALEALEAEPEVGLLLMTDVVVNADEKPVLGRNHKKQISQQTSGLSPNVLQVRQYKHQLYCAAHNLVCRTAWRDVLFGESVPEIAFAFDNWIYHVMGVLSDVRILPEPSMGYRRHGGNVTSLSRNTRNPITLFIRSIQHHMDVERIAERFSWFSQVARYLSSSGDPIRHPEVLDLYRRLSLHEECRLLAIAHPLWRPWLILRETCNGNYFRFSKGVKDLLTDAFSWPHRPKQNG